MTLYNITLAQYERIIYSKSNENLLKLLLNNGIPLYAPCGGKGNCGKCKVKIVGKTNDLTLKEKEILSKKEISNNIRLACETEILGDAKVYLLNEIVENKSKGYLNLLDKYVVNSSIIKKVKTQNKPTFKNGYSLKESIIGDFKNGDISIDLLKRISLSLNTYNEPFTLTFYDNEIIDYENKDTTNKNYGVAIDIGTTTIVCYLLDLNKGVQVSVDSMQNSQVGYGADVISRINYSMDNIENIKKMKNLLLEGIDKLIENTSKKADINKKNIYECVIAGNTTMHHLFWGLNTKSLAQIPFNPVTKDILIEKAQTVGLKSMNMLGKVISLPIIGGFVGGDTIGAILAADIKNGNNNILIDLGTNGEIVLSTSDEIYACSTAAGPAFEGAKIKCGMQAFDGAINNVKITEDISFTTINNKLAKGICGSGLIDTVSELLRVGIIESSGKIASKKDVKNKKLSNRIIKRGRTKEFILAYKKETKGDNLITLSQKDIRELQLAKGAIKAGINILLRVGKLDIKDVKNVFLAGAFGNFINKESALNIGLLPDIKLNKIIPLGNAAGEGAKKVLCDKDILKDALYYSKITKHIEISTDSNFQKEFIKEMVFNKEGI